MKLRRGLSAIGVTVTAALAAVMLPVTVGAQTQINDKWVTVVIPAEPPDLEGCYSSGSVQGPFVKQNIVETLAEKESTTGKLKPRLALSWQQVEPNTWHFKLRPNVSFHDGSPFNAANVKKSMDRVRGAGFVCRDNGKFLGDIKIETVVVDDLTVAFKTTEPEPIMPMRMAGVPIVGPNEPADKKSLKPVGTGPYVFDSWSQGTQILLKRNDKYWGQKPVVEGARFIWRAESAVRAAMIKLGEADITPTIALQDANDPKLDKPYLNSETSFFRIDATQKPLDDKRVRLALNYAIDREGIRNSLLSKDYLLATQMTMPAIPGHNHELDKAQRPYDPNKAKQLLAEAKADGVDVGKEILLQGRPSSYPEAAEILEASLAMYTAVGFNMKLRQLEPGEYAKWNNKPFPDPRQPGLLQSQHDNAYGDPIFTFPYRYMCGDRNNSTMCDPALDREIERVRGLGGDVRDQSWAKMAKTMYEEHVNEVFFYHMVANARVAARVNWIPDVSTNSEIRFETMTFNR